MARRNTPPTPNLNVQSTRITSRNLPDLSQQPAPPPDITIPDMSDEDSLLSSAEQAVKSDLSTRFLYADYYQKGINLIKPEILASLEFSPILKEDDALAGLQMTNLDGSTSSVNQVLRLIELHSAVQQAANEATRKFIDDFCGFDTRQFYNYLINEHGSGIENLLNKSRNPTESAETKMNDVVDEVIEIITPDIAMVAAPSFVQASNEVMDAFRDMLDDALDDINPFS